MKAGENATITATVYAFSTSNYADFYYATDGVPPGSWTYIDTVQAISSKVNNLSVDYELPQASIHIVRVNFRWGGSARYEADALIRVILT